MAQTRRNFIQSGIVAAGALGLMLTETAASAAERQSTVEGKTIMTTQDSTAAVLGGSTFDPAKWLSVPARTFEDLQVGDVFRAPSRTLTDAHTSEFQAISGDNHPRHYNAEYAKSHGMKAALVQPLQVLALSAPGASLFTHYVGESLVGFTETSCKFLVDSFAGDTLYPALEVSELSTDGGRGHVTTTISIYNQRGERVLSGWQKFVLKLSRATS